MKAYNILVFNEYMSDTVSLTTGVQYAEILGKPDKLAIQVIADRVTGTLPTFTLAIEHSNDGVHWFPLSAAPEISAQPINVPGPTALTAFDAGTAHSRLEHTRFTMSLAQAPTGVALSARIRVYAVGRDTGKNRACLCLEPATHLPKPEAH